MAYGNTAWAHLRTIKTSRGRAEEREQGDSEITTLRPHHCADQNFLRDSLQEQRRVVNSALAMCLHLSDPFGPTKLLVNPASSCAARCWPGRFSECLETDYVERPQPFPLQRQVSGSPNRISRRINVPSRSAANDEVQGETLRSLVRHLRDVLQCARERSRMTFFTMTEVSDREALRAVFPARPDAISAWTRRH